MLANTFKLLGGLVELGRAGEMMKLLERVHTAGQAANALAGELSTSGPPFPADAAMRAYAAANDLAELRGELRAITKARTALVPTAALLSTVTRLARAVRELAVLLTQDAPDVAVVAARAAVVVARASEVDAELSAAAKSSAGRMERLRERIQNSEATPPQA